jgi:glycosyltransferase involved in cell wall biosynthesis
MNRICFISPHIYGYFNSEIGFTGGGAERQIYLLIQELKQEYEIHVVVGDYGQPKQEVRDGVTLHRAHQLQPRQNALQPLKHLFLILKAMQRADADAYVYRGSPKNAGVVFLCARLLRRRWVYNVANDANLTTRASALTLPFAQLFEYALKSADGIIAQTDRQRKLLETRFSVGSSVVPNGYPPADNIPSQSKRDYFLWVGSLDKVQKQPHELLKVAESAPGAFFRLIGPVNKDDEYQQRIIQRAASQSNIRIEGSVPPNEIHDYYRDAIALINTSAYEGFPNTFLEAWRYGTPVLSLDIDPSRFLRGQEAGFADGEFETLAGLVRMLHDSVACRRVFGEHVREEFEATLTISETAAQYADALRAALR